MNSDERQLKFLNQSTAQKSNETPKKLTSEETRAAVLSWAKKEGLEKEIKNIWGVK